MEQLGSHWKDFLQVVWWQFIEISKENLILIKNGTKVSGTLYEDVSTFKIIRQIQTGHRTSNTMAQRRFDLLAYLLTYLLHGAESFLRS